MKRTLWYIVALLMLVAPMAACSEQAPATGQPDPPPQTDAPAQGGAQPGDGQAPGEAQAPPDDMPALEEPPLYSATIEYGEPDIIKDNNGPLYTYIRFPQGGDATDDAIADWAFGTHKNARTEFAEVIGTDGDATGEVNVNFDSWLVDERFVGVLERGMFMHSHMAHPRDFVQIFNMDLSHGSFLKNSEIIDPAQYEKALSLLRDGILQQYPDTRELLDDMDESWLSQLVISRDGVIVVLERYAFLPGILGTVTVTLPYSDLGSALILGAEPTPTPTPMPTPTPTPTPEPTPTPAPTEPSPSEPTPAEPSPTEPSPVPVAPPATDPDPDPSAPSPAPTSAPAPTSTPVPTPTPAPPEPIPIVPPQAGDIDPSKPMVALTFDDGPSSQTARILDTLEKYGARATFFTVGNLVKSRSATVERAVSLGCEVAGHSWDHKNLAKLSAADIRKQLTDTSNVIESVTGVAMPFYRPPYGSVSDTLKSVSKELGFALINWSVDPMDWDTRNADKTYNAIMKDTKNGSIVLSHDLYGATADAMTRVIPALIEKGYQLVTVSELLYYKHGTIEAGKVYY